jgi:hypothetical protein
MVARMAAGAGQALGLSQEDIREVVHRSACLAVDPTKHLCREEREQASRPWLRRFEAFLASEFSEAIEQAGITRSTAMHALIGQAFHDAFDEVYGPPWAPVSRATRRNTA